MAISESSSQNFKENQQTKTRRKDEAAIASSGGFITDEWSSEC